MKKVNDILNNFTFSKPSLAKLKTLLFYWSRENGKDFVWGDFMDKI